MATTLKFSLDSIEEVQESEQSLYEKAKKSRFAKVKIKLFSTGENAHTEPVDFEALENSADSAYDIPLIAELNPYRMNKDFGGHGTLTGKQFSFGFIKESKDNPIVFEKDEQTGKTFITLYGLIWKKYFKEIVDILMSNDSEAEVSVELDVLKGEMSKNGKPILKQFVLNAVTFLGKITTAACQGAMAQLVFSAENETNFAQDKKDYLEGKFENNHIKISNDKETAVNGKWTNPRQKLLAPILKASNKTELLNEAYLFWDDKGEDITVSDVSYPHHIIKNGELVLHIRGVQSAFARLSQQDKVEGDAKAHLIRHYRTLGLNRDNFEDFGLTSEQFELYFSTDFGKEEIMLDAKEKMEDSVITEEIEKEKVDETEEIKEEEIKESCKVEEEHNSTNPEECEEKMEDSEVEKKDSENCDDKDDLDDTKEDKDDLDDTKETETTDEVKEENSDILEELKKENERLTKENEAYMAKIEEMSDYEELKQFKADVIEKEAKMQEMAEMTKVMQSLEEKGVKVTSELKEELTNKRQNFENTTAWANYVKAYVFDNCEISKTDDGIIKFDIAESFKNNENSDTNNVWVSLKNKFRN